MATFILDNFELLLEPTYLLSQVDEKANLLWSPQMFSLIASNPSCPFIAELRLDPEFFSFFYIHQFLHFRINLSFFYSFMLNMANRCCTSMTFTLYECLHLGNLSFQSSLHEQGHLFHRNLTLSPLEEKENVAEIDYGTFLAIDSKEFSYIVEELGFSDWDPVCVTLTDSLVKFHVAAKEFTFTKEEMACTIRGLAPGEETQFFLTLHPMMFFLTSYSERIWLFKSTNKSYSTIIFPFGLQAQFLIYFPQGCLPKSRL